MVCLYEKIWGEIPNINFLCLVYVGSQIAAQTQIE